MAPGPQAIALAERLYARSRAERWGLSRERFAAAIEASLAHASRDRGGGALDADRHADSLHLEDLALAAACAEGSSAAWDHVMAEIRPGLYRAADAIDPTGGAREIADALYAELFGVTERGGARQSLLLHFHGRSRLSTWLRAVLSQRFVDRLRATRRVDPLPEEDGAQPLISKDATPDPDRARLAGLVGRALKVAISELDARDRLRLDFYYAQDLTLAQIGRVLGEHEATVSRHLTRTRRAIRDRVMRALREEHGLNDGAIAQGLEAVVGDAGTLDVRQLLGGSPAGKNPAEDRSS